MQKIKQVIYGSPSDCKQYIYAIMCLFLCIYTWIRVQKITTKAYFKQQIPHFCLGLCLSPSPFYLEHFLLSLSKRFTKVGFTQRIIKSITLTLGENSKQMILLQSKTFLKYTLLQCIKIILLVFSFCKNYVKKLQKLLAVCIIYISLWLFGDPRVMIPCLMCYRRTTVAMSFFISPLVVLQNI